MRPARRSDRWSGTVPLLRLPDAAARCNAARDGDAQGRVMTAAEQLALDFREIVTPEYAAEATLAERFAAFHEANPHVADALETLAEQWLARHRKVGMKSLAEQVRWASGMQTTGEPWRINNSHVAFYARLLVARRPEWREALDLRRSEADEVDWTAAEWRRAS